MINKIEEWGQWARQTERMGKDKFDLMYRVEDCR